MLAETTPDLFLDRQDQLGYRDLVNLMEYPFFAISKNPVFENRIYDDGKVRFEVKPGHAGIATIWDKDVLIYVASQINRLINQGQPVSQKVRFHAHDFFVSCGRSKGGRSYTDLVATLDRLQSTALRTNITTKNGQIERGFFSWIKSGRMTEHQLPNGKRALGMVEVELEDWVYRQIVEDRTILSISAAYFELTSGIARRLYEIARKHCGKKESWSIALPRLAEKIGYEGTDRRYFKRELLTILAANALPEFTMHMSLVGDKEDKVIAEPREIRGIDKLKAVFSRRPNVIERRAEPDVGVPEENVSDRRPVSPAPSEEPPQDLVTPDQMAELTAHLDRLASKARSGSKA